MEMGKLARGYRHYPRPTELGPADYARLQPEKSEHIAHCVKARKSAKNSCWLFLHARHSDKNKEHSSIATTRALSPPSRWRNGWPLRPGASTANSLGIVQRQLGRPT